MRVSSVAGYKVLLDDIYYEHPDMTSGVNTVPMDRLAWKVGSQLSALSAVMAARPEVVPCEGRKPRNDTDFDRRQVNQLNAQDVILEVWGTVQAQKKEGGGNPSAFVGFAVIPLRFYEYFEKDSQEIRGVYFSEYTLGTATPAEDLLKQSLGFQAYVALGIGLKALKNYKYNVALKSACQAELILKSMNSKELSPDQAALLSYARAMAISTVRQAEGDPKYRGIIREIAKSLQTDNNRSVCGGRKR